MTARAQGHAPQTKGGQLDNPQGVTQATGLNSPQNITPTKF